MGSAELFNAAPDYFIHLEGTLHLKLNQKIAKSPLQIYIYIYISFTTKSESSVQLQLFLFSDFLTALITVRLDEACSSSYNNVDGG